MPDPANARAQAEAWLAEFVSALRSRDIRAAAALFGEECYWRGLVAFTWNIKTLEGAAEISAMLAANLDAASPSNWQIDGEPTAVDGVVEAWLRFETKVARGRGILRLKNGRAWTLLTTMDELKGFEEAQGDKRSQAAQRDHPRRL